MPLRVNYAGVMPIIFAQAILMFPQQILNFLGKSFNLPFLQAVGNALQEGSFFYMLLYAAMILFFSYFWVATQFNEIQIADDLKKHGGYIPGVRPGQATSDFLHNAMSRITLAGAVFPHCDCDDSDSFEPCDCDSAGSGNLLRWHEYFDFGRCDARYDAPDGIPSVDAPL